MPKTALLSIIRVCILARITSYNVCYTKLLRYPFTNHNAAIVNVKHANGNFSTYFNMKNRTGVWHSLGVFRIEKGGDNYIEFTSPSKGGVCADAVIFRPVVITSYSIHYTKLYEWKMFPDQFL